MPVSRSESLRSVRGGLEAGAARQLVRARLRGYQFVKHLQSIVSAYEIKPISMCKLQVWIHTGFGRQGVYGLGRG